MNNQNNLQKRSLLRRTISKIIIIIGYASLLTIFLYLIKVFDFSAQENAISVYAFPNIIPLEAIAEFEQTTGIKVHIQYFESNEELLAKFRISHGEGYDLITPSDYMVEILNKEKLLQPIDKSKISTITELDQHLLNQYFDPQNTYSLPYIWTVYGITYDKELFSKESIDVGFDLIFKNPQEIMHKGLVSKPYKVCMTDDGREATFFSSIYLYGKTHGLSPENFTEIQSLLIQQKPWVECYTDASLQYFLVGNIASAAIIGSNHMKKIWALTNRFEFKIPQEGSVWVIENIAIPAHSKKAHLTHRFIDFILSKSVALKQFDLFGNNPSNSQAYTMLPKSFITNENIFPTPELYSKLYLIHNDIPLHYIDTLWMGVKFA